MTEAAVQLAALAFHFPASTAPNGSQCAGVSGPPSAFGVAGHRLPRLARNQR